MNADYCLRELRRALHDPQGSKAAVMVGAGFSLNAEPIGNAGASFPDWALLTHALVTRLYPSVTEQMQRINEAGAVSSALRFAQEFEVAFGRPALIDLVRKSIRDSDFVPGETHRHLMELPWADVFTTNYDRLLERAAEGTWNIKYDTVLGCDDLPLARRPRIVKLHGSLPDLRGLILTEDDFRAYPRRFAPFVNAVQASLSENIFCLIGFSANDPNFLAWTGWVRDELANSAPYMFLFTGNDLQPFQRQLLETRRIVPVQIRQLANTRDYKTAYQWLFSQLRHQPDSSRAVWNRIPDYAAVTRNGSDDAPEPLHATSGESSEKRQDELLNTAIIWRQNRKEFKGWHILHREGINSLWARTHLWIRDVTVASLAKLDPPMALLVLHELAWRFERCLNPLPDNVVFEVIDPTIERFRKWKILVPEGGVTIGDHSVSREELCDFELKLYLELLRHAREIGDADRFKTLEPQVEAFISGRELPANANERHFVAHQQVLLYLSQFKHGRARQLLQSWDVTSANMIWTVRRAGLLLECGLIEIAKHSLSELLGSIRRIPATTEAQIPELSAEGLLQTLWWYLLKAEEFDNLTKTIPKNNTESADDTEEDTDEPTIHSRTSDLAALDRDPRNVTEARQTSPQTGPKAGNRNKAGNVPDEQTIRERLRRFHKLRCDPHDVFDWLTLENKANAEDGENTSEHDGVDLGTTRRTARLNGNSDRARLAYQGLRFMEESGLPISIHGVIATSVGRDLFNGATVGINTFSFREAIGPMLRAQDDKLIERCLTREKLYHLPDRHFEWLKKFTKSAFNTALSRLGSAPKHRESEDQWQEKQLRTAVLVQSRIIVRQNEAEIVELLRRTLPLIADQRTASRWNVRSEITTLNERALTYLSDNAIASLLPDILGIPVPGTEDWPEKAYKYRESDDPTSALMRDSRRRVDRNSKEVAGNIAKCIELAKSEQKSVRTHALLRLAALHWSKVLTTAEQRDVAEAMYRDVDEFGLPQQTGLIDGFVLSLPKPKATDEAKCFRMKYLQTDQVGDKDWRELERTVAYFRRPIEPIRRSIRWRKRDLDLILAKGERWSPDAEKRLRNTKDKAGTHPLFAHFSGVEGLERAFDSFVGVIESVVLLHPAVSARQIDRASILLNNLKVFGIETVLARPALAFRKADKLRDVHAAIEEALVAKSDQTFRQGREALVRLCQLSQTGGGTVTADRCLITLASLLYFPVIPRLPQLLFTASDAIDVLSRKAPAEFVDRLERALTILRGQVTYDGEELNISFNQRISIRAACAAVAISLQREVKKSATIAEWIASAKNDPFAEVRREVE